MRTKQTSTLSPARAPLSGIEAEVLLFGFGEAMMRRTSLSPDDEAIVRGLLERGDEGFIQWAAETWQQHERWLRGEARRLNIAPVHRVGTRLLFGAEALAERVRRQSAATGAKG